MTPMVLFDSGARRDVYATSNDRANELALVAIQDNRGRICSAVGPGKPPSHGASR